MFKVDSHVTFTIWSETSLEILEPIFASNEINFHAADKVCFLNL